jgi:hypothetical protein
MLNTLHLSRGRIDTGNVGWLGSLFCSHDDITPRYFIHIVSDQAMVKLALQIPDCFDSVNKAESAPHVTVSASIPL